MYYFDPLSIKILGMISVRRYVHHKVLFEGLKSYVVRVSEELTFTGGALASVGGFTFRDDLTSTERFTSTERLAVTEGITSIEGLALTEGFTSVGGLALTDGFTSTQDLVSTGSLFLAEGFASGREKLTSTVSESISLPLEVSLLDCVPWLVLVWKSSRVPSLMGSAACWPGTFCTCCGQNCKP